MQAFLLLMNLSQVIVGQLSGDELEKADFGIVASYETIRDCNDALLDLISTFPENPDDWTVNFYGGSAVATSGDPSVLFCVPQLDSFSEAMARSRSTSQEAELAFLDALASQKAASTALDSMTARITKEWKRPAGFEGGLEVYLRMTLKPNGTVESVRVVKTSGNAKFDDSGIKAIRAAAPFIEVTDFDSEVFEERFKSLTVKFRPED